MQTSQGLWEISPTSLLSHMPPHILGGPSLKSPSLKLCSRRGGGRYLEGQVGYQWGVTSGFPGGGMRAQRGGEWLGQTS